MGRAGRVGSMGHRSAGRTTCIVRIPSSLSSRSAHRARCRRSSRRAGPSARPSPRLFLINLARSARPPLLSFPLAPSMKLCCGPRTQAAWCRAHSSPVGRRRSPAPAQSFFDLGRTLSRASSCAPASHHALRCTGLMKVDERCREGDGSAAKESKRRSSLFLSLSSFRPRADLLQDGLQTLDDTARLHGLPAWTSERVTADVETVGTSAPPCTLRRAT